jgi:hypothetical protein
MMCHQSWWPMAHVMFLSEKGYHDDCCRLNDCESPKFILKSSNPPCDGVGGDEAMKAEPL